MTIRPKDVPAEGIRKLPTPGPRQSMLPEQEMIAAMQVASAPTVSPLPAANAPAGTSPENDLTDSGFTPRDEAGSPPTLTPSPTPTLVPTTPLFRPRDRSRIEPVAEGRWQWRIGLDRELKAELDTLKG